MAEREGEPAESVRGRGHTRGQKSVLVVGLHKGIGNLAAAVDGRDEDQQRAAGHEQAQCAGAGVAVFVCEERAGGVSGGGMGEGKERRPSLERGSRTASRLFHVVEDQVHQLVVAFECAGHC